MTSADQGSPRHVLAMDIAALGAGEEGWIRFGDRLATIRLATVLVYIGDTPYPGLPDPDYVIDVAGELITRLPAGDTIEEWPQPGRPTGIAPALEHLAEGLLVPTSEVYTVLGADRAIPAELERVVVIGEGPAPEHAVRASAADEDAVIAALEETQLFGRSTVTAPDISDTAFEAALDTLRRNVTPLGFSAASLADNPLNSHDANYASVWARDGIITGLWTLCLDDPELIRAFRNTVRVLAKHQAPSGQIPANVRIAGEQPDYSGIGGIASIDSVIWFVIGAVFQHRSGGDREPYARDRHIVPGEQFFNRLFIT